MSLRVSSIAHPPIMPLSLATVAPGDRKKPTIFQAAVTTDGQLFPVTASSGMIESPDPDVSPYTAGTQATALRLHEPGTHACQWGNFTLLTGIHGDQRHKGFHECVNRPGSVPDFNWYLSPNRCKGYHLVCGQSQPSLRPNLPNDACKPLSLLICAPPYAKGAAPGKVMQPEPPARRCLNARLICPLSDVVMTNDIHPRPQPSSDNLISPSTCFRKALSLHCLPAYRERAPSSWPCL